MSVLAWLFGLGALAVAFPFLFHLIRRTPKGKTEFSSLMFVDPSPPSLTQKSRLENLLLLVLRCAAIALIAFAFMRPFIRDGGKLVPADLSTRKIAILVDLSASMRRGDLWQQANNRVREITAECGPRDDVALFGFDRRLHSCVGFDRDSDSSADTDAIRTTLNEIQPSWHRADLGIALTQVADLLSHTETAEDALQQSQIIVISDLQKSTVTTALQNYQWPPNVQVDLRPVSLKDTSNASLLVLEPPADQQEPELRVRIENSPDSKIDQYFVAASDDPAADNLPVYVPSGTSRVAKVQPIAKSGQLSLRGDPYEYDNVFYVAQPEPLSVAVGYLGKDSADDASGYLFYLERALMESAARKITIEQNFEPAEEQPLLFVTAPMAEPQTAQLHQYVDNGGTAVVVIDRPAMVEAVADWLSISEPSGGTQEKPGSFTTDQYAMFAAIDFAHPVFEPLSGPRFNDFTKIRIWDHRRLELPDEAAILARFDDNSPAIWQQPIGKGKVIGFAFGWHPDASQLALSSKFLPLVNSLVDFALDRPEPALRCLVGDSIVVGRPGETVTITRPDATVVELEPDAPLFAETDLPGIYSVKNGSRNSVFAVNMDRAESDAAVLTQEQLEGLGVDFGQTTSADDAVSVMQNLKDIELENSQKLWKWLIVAALLFIVLETWLAGRTERRTLQTDSNLLASES